jgi:hypothetical protein
MNIREQTARAMFDSLGGDGIRIPDWDKQPEHLKDIWRLKATPNPNGSKIEFHYGANRVWLIRPNGTLVTYIAWTGAHRAKQDHAIRQKFKRLQNNC